MTKKKIIARVGALLACVLLLGALAVPCFADDVKYNYSDDQYDKAYHAWYSDFSFKGYESFEYLVKTLYNDNPRTVMNHYMIFSAQIGEYGLVSEETSLPLTTEFICDFAFSFNDGKRITSGALGGTVLYEYYFNEAYFSVVTFCDYSGTVIMRLIYTSSDASGNFKLNSLYCNGKTYGFSSINDITITISCTNNYTSYPYGINNIASLFVMGSYSYPAAFMDAYTIGYATGALLGDVDGFDEGRDFGYALGYDDGYKEGYNEAVDGDAYKAGYDDAVKEIETGDFGRNLIGSIFKAPFDTLRNFVLVEWKAANGFTMTITLATLFSAIVGLSLFVWFLKTFKGG